MNEEAEKSSNATAVRIIILIVFGIIAIVAKHQGLNERATARQTQNIYTEDNPPPPLFTAKDLDLARNAEEDRDDPANQAIVPEETFASTPVNFGASSSQSGNVDSSSSHADEWTEQDQIGLAMILARCASYTSVLVPIAAEYEGLRVADQLEERADDYLNASVAAVTTLDNSHNRIRELRSEHEGFQSEYLALVEAENTIALRNFLITEGERCTRVSTILAAE